MVARMMLCGALLAVGCASAPKGEAKQTELRNKADAATAAILNKSPEVKALLDQSAGYIMFPEVSEGGFIIGGSGAKGVIYEGGQPTAFADLSRVSFGALAGGHKYAELVVIRDQSVLDKIKSGTLDLGGQAAATIVTSGASAQANFGKTGVAVIVNPLGGAMLNLSLNGQQLKQTLKM